MKDWHLLKARLDLAHITLQDGVLSRPACELGDLVPGEIWQVGEGDDAVIEWRWWEWDPEQLRPFPQTRSTDQQVLEKFLRLADADPQRVLAFAQRYGVLVLCKDHGLPATHAPPVKPQSNPLVISRCQIAYSEPVSRWRQFAREARALLAVAASVYRKAVPREDDWKAAFGADGDRLFPEERRTVALAEDLLARHVQDWLDIAGVTLALRRTDDGLRVRMGGLGVFAAVTRQLAAALVRTRGSAFCYSCGEWFEPDRRPRRNQRTWCDKEECRKEAHREAQRRYSTR